MINIRTVETDRVEDSSAIARIVEGLYLSDAHIEAQCGLDTQVSYINLSGIMLYVKSANGMIKAINPASNDLAKRAVREGEYDQLIIQTKRVMRFEDVMANYKYLLQYVKPEEFDTEQLLVKKSYEKIITYQSKYRLGELSTGSSGIVTMSEEEYALLMKSNNAPVVKSGIAKNVKAQIDAGMYDNVERLDDSVVKNKVDILRSTYRLRLSAVISGNTSPLYIAEHDIMVAAGEAGLKRLREVPHPGSKQYQAVTGQFLSTCYQDKLVVEGLNHYLKNNGYPPEGYIKETKRFMYSIEIVDNEGKYGTLWCHMFGKIVPIHPFKRESAHSGIYVTTTTVDQANPSRPIVGFTRYQSVEDIPDIKLYRSLQEAQNSNEFRANVEYTYKQRDQELKLMEQSERVRVAEASIVINNQKHQLDINKLDLEKKRMESDAAKMQFETNKLKDEIEKQKNEREKVERDMERARLAHERDIEKMRLEKESILLKHAAERAKFKADREAEVRKAKADAYRAAQERESIKAKQKAESRGFTLKFISDMIKYVPAIVKAGTFFVKKFMSVSPESIVQPT